MCTECACSFNAPPTQTHTRFSLRRRKWSPGTTVDAGTISVHSTPWALAGERRSEARASALTLTSCPQVTRLCDLSVEGDSVTSVGWSERVSEEGEPCGHL